MGLVHNSSIVTNGLVLCLDAANRKSYPGSGTTWTDLSGRGNNGNLNNGVGYTSANVGSLTFDGVNAYASWSSNSSFNFAQNNFSIESIFFYDNSTASDDTYRQVFFLGLSNNYISVVKWRSGIANGLNIDYSVNGNRYCITTPAEIPSPSVRVTVTSLQYSVPNRWTHLVVTVESNIMYLYLNNILYGNVLLSERWNVTPTLNIGSNPTPASFMKGSIPMFRMYNRALSAAEIQQNFNALRGRYGL